MCSSVVRCGSGGGRDREIKKAQSCRGLRWRPVREKTVVPTANLGRGRRLNVFPSVVILGVEIREIIIYST